MLSSATNFLLGLFIARTVSPQDFGSFSVAYAVFTFSLGAVRAISGELLVVRHSAVPQSDWRRGTKGAAGSTLMTGAVVGLGCIAVGALGGGAFRIVLIVVGISLPGLLIQDTWRFAFFARGRGSAALLNDLVWAVAMFAAFALLWRSELSSVAWLTFAWAAAGCLAALVGLLQLRILPSGPSAAFGWLRQHRDLAPRFLAEFAVTSGASSLALFGIGSLAGLGQLGRLRAGQVALGPLNILFVGTGMVATPEGVRLLEEAPRRLVRACGWVSLALASGALVWGALVLSLPQGVGEFLLGVNWEGARSLLLPLSIGAAGFGSAFGAWVGLRSLAAAKRSLRGRYIDALATTVLAVGGAALAGALGAAWGYAIAGCVRIPNAWWQFTRALGEYERGPAPSDSPVPPVSF
jgi:hypothetical protein